MPARSRPRTSSRRLQLHPEAADRRFVCNLPAKFRFQRGGRRAHRRRRAYAEQHQCYRFNVVHGQGESYVPESSVNRTLASSGALDFHVAERTVIETNFSHYSTNITGLPGSFVYFNGASTILPKAVDQIGLAMGSRAQAPDLITDTGLVKLKHEINNDWNFEIGGLYQDAVRNLFGITNTMTDNRPRR